MTVPRLLAFAYGAFGVLGFTPALPGLAPLFRLPPLFCLAPLLCLAALLAVGELWLRALTGEPAAPAVRLGLAATAGLLTLPLVAIVLHLLGVPIRARSLAVTAAAVATVLGAVVLLRERSVRLPADPRLLRTLLAVAIPGGLVLAVGGAAVLAYERLPHPPQPGFTSVALGGWAAGIDHPIAIPARGLPVPIDVTSAGRGASTVALRVLIADRAVGAARPVEVEPGVTRSVAVHVPAPATGCPQRVEISLGPASTVFYAYGPAAC
jgi:hypothetical protein